VMSQSYCDITCNSPIIVACASFGYGGSCCRFQALGLAADVTEPNVGRRDFPPRVGSRVSARAILCSSDRGRRGLTRAEQIVELGYGYLIWGYPDVR
jgi:hypothetical protein